MISSGVIFKNNTITSPIGQNSDNVISGGNWSGNIYTGQAEQNNYAYVGINLQVDEDGTLTFEFSQDGVNFSNYPTQEFTITSGINEVHGAWKGTRYFRVRFTGTGGRTFFRLRTMYSNEPVVLSAPLNQPISGDQDATIVRAVSIGENPNGSFSNAKEGGYQDMVTTNTPLGSSASYDSGIMDLEGFTQLWTELSSDVSGTLVGTWYDDAAGTNVVRTFTAPYNPSEGLFFSTTVILGRYLRYQYTNDAVAQTRFHFRLKLDSRAYSGQMLKVNSFIPSNVLAALTRSVITGLNPDGTYQNVRLNDGNSLVTADFFTEVALDNVDNFVIGTKFGRNPDIDIGQTEDMWNGGGDYTGQPAGFTPSTMNVSSSSALDMNGMTGAWTVRVTGLQDNTSTEYTSEIVTLNGVTPVATVNSYYRVNRLEIITAGTGGENAGDITVAATSDATVFIVAPTGFNQSTIGAYTVPAGQTMLIKRVRLAITRANGSAGSATITLRVRPPGEVYRAIRVFELQTGAITEFSALGGIIVPAGSDIKYRIETVSDSNTVAEGAFEYILEAI